MRLKNTEPGSLHMTARIYNHTNVNTGDCTGPDKNSCTIDNANGNRVVATLTVPDMPSELWRHEHEAVHEPDRQHDQDADCLNPGGLGKAAFALQGGNDGKDAVHAHPDDKTDDMKILIQYLTYSQWQANGNSCADNGARRRGARRSRPTASPSASRSAAWRSR